MNWQWVIIGSKNALRIECVSKRQSFQSRVIKFAWKFSKNWSLESMSPPFLAYDGFAYNRPFCLPEIRYKQGAPSYYHFCVKKMGGHLSPCIKSKLKTCFFSLVYLVTFWLVFSQNWLKNTVPGFLLLPWIHSLCGFFPKFLPIGFSQKGFLQPSMWFFY